MHVDDYDYNPLFKRGDNMPQLHETPMGKKFYQYQLPKLIKELEKSNKLKEEGVTVLHNVYQALRDIEERLKWGAVR